MAKIVEDAAPFGLRWEPFARQLVVRATYAKGFVAPSIFALFGPPLAEIAQICAGD